MLRSTLFCEEGIRILQRMQDLTILVTNRANTAFLDPPTEDLLSIPITHKDPLSLLTMIHFTAIIYTRAFELLQFHSLPV